MNEETHLQLAERLENTFRIWEDTLLHAQAVFTRNLQYGGHHESTECLTGSVIHWSEFRKDLLMRKPLDWEKYELPKTVAEKFFLRSPVFDKLPYLLHKWTMTSRRIYDLHPDFQRSLEMTSLGKVTWKDITPPFPIFGFNLPIPVPWAINEGKGEVDFVFVDFFETGVCVMALDRDLCGRKFVAPEKKRRLMRAIENREYSFLRAYFHGLPSSYYIQPSTQAVIFTFNEKPILEELDGFGLTYRDSKEGEGNCPDHKEAVLPEFCRLISRLVAGLCLHLEVASKSKKESEIAVEERKNQRPKHVPTFDKSVICDEAMVCAVKLVTPLTTEEVEYHTKIRAIGSVKASSEMPVHFRKTYWRRRPGTGQNPDAPKCVKVKWTWVNKHRLPAEGLPVGSEVLVK